MSEKGEIDLVTAILDAVAARGQDKTICPSEIARACWPRDWRSKMNAVRRCAYNLQEANLIDITQAGEVVDGRQAKGAIRLRIKL